MGRGLQVAILGAVVVGSLGGGLAALAVTAQPPAARSAAPPAPQPQPPIARPAPVPASPDPRAALQEAMRAVLTRFAAWSRDHAGEPCPDLAALGVDGRDPWGHPLQLTCTDQPADQRIGAISPGPDGIAGSDDDLASWTLGREVTELVRGARWPVAAAPHPAGKRRGSAPAASPPPHRPPAAPQQPAASNPPALAPAASPVDASTDDIPMRR